MHLCGLLTYGVHAQRDCASVLKFPLYILYLHSASALPSVTAHYCSPVCYHYQHVLMDGMCFCSGVQRT